MPFIFAYDTDSPFSSYDFALAAYLFDRRPDFHGYKLLVTDAAARPILSTAAAFLNHFAHHLDL
jgi:hypothetical protein